MIHLIVTVLASYAWDPYSVLPSLQWLYILVNAVTSRHELSQHLSGALASPTLTVKVWARALHSCSVHGQKWAAEQHVWRGRTGSALHVSADTEKAQWKTVPYTRMSRRAEVEDSRMGARPTRIYLDSLWDYVKFGINFVILFLGNNFFCKTKAHPYWHKQQQANSWTWLCFVHDRATQMTRFNGRSK